MSTIRGGYLNRFETDLNKLQDNKTNFQVVSSGLTRKIIFNQKEDKSKRLYFGHQKSDILPGVHMVNAVRRNIDNYIESGKPIPKLEYRPKLVLYNFMEIEKAINKNPRDLTNAIDINACYFKTAYNLGFINEDLYKKGWEKRKENKLGLLASIGSLNKHETIETYKNGKLKTTDTNWEYKNKYSPFYWAIINKVAEVMMEIAHALGENFYMWLTDCVYVDRDKKKIATDILDKYGYDYKSFYIEFTDLRGRQLNWYDFKANEEKYINHNILLNYTKNYTPFIKNNYDKYGFKK
tara:strand:+ start:2930 stop:3811 length:882 start_codon:yes stop_codon:yes gene_type:complete